MKVSRKKIVILYFNMNIFWCLYTFSWKQQDDTRSKWHILFEWMQSQHGCGYNISLLPIRKLKSYFGVDKFVISNRIFYLFIYIQLISSTEYTFNVFWFVMNGISELFAERNKLFSLNKQEKKRYTVTQCTWRLLYAIEFMQRLLLSFVQCLEPSALPNMKYGKIMCIKLNESDFSLRQHNTKHTSVYRTNIPRIREWDEQFVFVQCN